MHLITSRTLAALIHCDTHSYTSRSDNAHTRKHCIEPFSAAWARLQLSLLLHCWLEKKSRVYIYNCTLLHRRRTAYRGEGGGGGLLLLLLCWTTTIFTNSRYINTNTHTLMHTHRFTVHFIIKQPNNSSRSKHHRPVERRERANGGKRDIACLV